MKEYGCSLKFRRGDNSTYTFTKRGVVYLVSTTPPKRLIISGLGGVVLTRYMDRRTDGKETYRGPYIDAFCHIWFHLAQLFQRSRLKYEKVNGRTTDTK
jgi:hypothetical protein